MDRKLGFELFGHLLHAHKHFRVPYLTFIVSGVRSQGAAPTTATRAAPSVHGGEAARAAAVRGRRAVVIGAVTGVPDEGGAGENPVAARAAKVVEAVEAKGLEAPGNLAPGPDTGTVVVADAPADGPSTVRRYLEETQEEPPK